jgi:non-lysosomal glucosylceramidase
MGKQTGRRGFLKSVALATAAVSEAEAQAPAAAPPPAQAPAAAAGQPAGAVTYPRRFTGRNLAMIAFPLGGICAGSIALGGRGQLRDWEIFNRSERGRSPQYAFPAIWVQAGNAKPVARVLESRILPPYEGRDGLGAQNAPGLSRLAGATFTGEYPVARVEFRDPKLPVRVRLGAFSPFVPHDAEDSGLPVAVLRYRVSNPGKSAAKVSIAFAIDNPVSAEGPGANSAAAGRVNEFKQGDGIEGLFMRNPGLDAGAPRAGSFVLAVLNPQGGRVSHLSGWPKARWWTSPLLYWDDFTADGELGPETGARDAVGSLCLQREVPPGAEAEFEFLLAWHFPNRTPARMGWSSDKGHADTVIGNYYCERFPDAWQAAGYAARKLPDLEKKMRQFLTVMRETTVPDAVKEAAMANASTLAATTCFRTKDGRFFGWEGSGCCHGNCDHVWNYESTTHFLFPAMARSMRETHLEVAERMNGQMPIRANLPLGYQTAGTAAADGQMGQIIKAYLDWQLAADDGWLKKWWPSIKKSLEFAWVKGGWDGDRDGVFEGVQHNTYDVEFYGPNPMCGIYYLGALRAGEEMARAAGDADAAAEYRKLFERGREWIDGKLFNGEYYVQQIRGIPREEIAPGLIAGMGAEDPSHPDYQMGEGCLADQLVGQYVADYAGLGPLTSPEHIRTTMQSVYRYNYRKSFAEHDNTERTYVLNDEAALLVCDYGKGKRPEVPFPYFSEAWTGLEYTAAALMIAHGMVRQGCEIVESARRRYDGERRNPWDESECGPHYARAMSAWSTLLALSGFRYGRRELAIAPRVNAAAVRSFWAAGTGWGSFAHRKETGQTKLTITVMSGKLPLESVELAAGAAGPSTVRAGSRSIAHEVKRSGGRAVVRFSEALELGEGELLTVTV